MNVPLPFSNSAWLVASVLFALHQLLQYGVGVSLPFADNYLDPFLSVPILLGGVLQERTWLFGQRRFSLLETVVATVFIALVSELVFPRLDPRFVYDSLDFGAFVLGGFYFWCLVNPAKAVK